MFVLEDLVKIVFIVKFLGVFGNNRIVGVFVLINIEFIRGVKFILFVGVVWNFVVLGILGLLIVDIVIVLFESCLLWVMVVDLIYGKVGFVSYWDWFVVLFVFGFDDDDVV